MSEDDGRQIMYIRDGGVGERQMVLGTVRDLMSEVVLADCADYEVNMVFALDQMGELREVAWSAKLGKFDEQDLASGVVEVVFPDGARETAPYTVDGRS